MHVEVSGHDRGQYPQAERTAGFCGLDNDLAKYPHIRATSGQI